jgi:uncharacterized protein (TIGR02594 family)
MRRRAVLTGAVGFAAGVLGGRLMAQDRVTMKGDYADFTGPLPSIRLFGTNPARPKEEELAIRILKGAPRTVGTLPVAHYFESVADVNEDGESYNAAWEKRWNPVIVGFYKNTQLEDKYKFEHGDTIPWCAAFLNWCLAAAELPSTQSASSSSFRKYGVEVQEPRPGDVVVFKHADPDKAAAGRGHVGFFDGFDGDKIRVLGGNQKGGRRFSSVCFSSFPKQSNALIFHSYRRPNV